MHNQFKILVFSALLFILGSVAFASDAGAGNIWYEFEGDSANPYLYRVNIVIYNDNGQGNYFTPTRNVCISSSCFADMSISLPFVGVYNGSAPNDTIQVNYPGAIITPFLTECIDTNLASNFAVSEIHFFSGLVTLPGKCSDIRFSSRTFSRRSYDNLLPAIELFIYADLNNIYGPNSSAIFVNPAAKSFCLGHPFIWSLGAVDADGDSLLYELASAKGGNSCYTPNNIPFQAGYSVSQPFATLNGVGLNPKNGFMSFEATQQQIVAFNIKVSEFRQVNGIWTLIAKTERGLQLSFVQGCNQNLMYGPVYDTTSYSTQLARKDSLLGYGYNNVFVRDSVVNPAVPNSYLLQVPSLRYSCFDSVVSVKFESGIWCESIADDGSDFRLIGPDSVMIPNVGVGYTCGNDGYVSSVDILLHKPIDVNGNYMLLVKTGNDGNTLIGRCGFEMPNFSLAIVKVENCPVPDYVIVNVTVVEDKQVQLHWKADSNSYSDRYFNGWEVFRSTGTMSGFYPIGNAVFDSSRFYIDSSFAPELLDEMSFDYKIRLVQNFNPRSLSKSIGTILLSSSVVDTTNQTEIRYDWSSFDGWLDPHYEIFIGNLAWVGQNINWVSLKGPDHGFNSITHQFSKITPANERIVVAKVVASNPSDTINNFTSESNWVFIDFVYTPPKPEEVPRIINIPNVFTPNNDGVNDFFTIDSDFQTVSIGIYNRWGELVFEDSSTIQSLSWDGKHYRNLHMVSDGVYYYVATFKASVNDGFGNYKTIEESRKGSVTVIGN